MPKVNVEEVAVALGCHCRPHDLLMHMQDDYLLPVVPPGTVKSCNDLDTPNYEFRDVGHKVFVGCHAGVWEDDGIDVETTWAQVRPCFSNVKDLDAEVTVIVDAFDNIL